MLYTPAPRAFLRKGSSGGYVPRISNVMNYRHAKPCVGFDSNLVGQRSHRDAPPADWLHIPVPPLVDAVVFATVQEQLAENRRRARQGLRGARYLLQGLVCCAQCVTRSTVGRSARPSAGSDPAATRITVALAPTHIASGASGCATTSAPTCWTPLFDAMPALFWSNRTVWNRSIARDWMSCPEFCGDSAAWNYAA